MKQVGTEKRLRVSGSVAVPKESKKRLNIVHQNSVNGIVLSDGIMSALIPDGCRGIIANTVKLKSTSGIAEDQRPQSHCFLYVGFPGSCRPAGQCITKLVSDRNR